MNVIEYSKEILTLIFFFYFKFRIFLGEYVKNLSAIEYCSIEFFLFMNIIKSVIMTKIKRT